MSDQYRAKESFELDSEREQELIREAQWEEITKERFEQIKMILVDEFNWGKARAENLENRATDW